MNITTIFLILGLMCGSHGYSLAKGITRTGLKAGLVIAGMSGENRFVDESTMRTGFSAGGFLTFALDEVWAIHGEAIYTAKGGKFQFIRTSSIGPDEIQRVDATWNLGYIEIPLLIQASFLTSGSITPTLGVGVAPAIEVVSTVTFEGDGLTPETHDADDVNSFDIGVVLSGGMGINIGSGEILGEIRYTYGLINTNKAADGIEAFESDEFVRNTVISFLVGYSFR